MTHPVQSHTSPTETRRLLAEAIESKELTDPGMAPYARAAAAAFLLAVVEGEELAFHPFDCASFEDPDIAALVEACPELDQRWRELLAAKQLVRWLGKAMKNDPARTTNGLTAIASAAGEPSSHHDHARQISGPALIELLEIATREVQ